MSSNTSSLSVEQLVTCETVQSVSLQLFQDFTRIKNELKAYFEQVDPTIVSKAKMFVEDFGGSKKIIERYNEIKASTPFIDWYEQLTDLQKEMIEYLAGDYRRSRCMLYNVLHGGFDGESTESIMLVTIALIAQHFDEVFENVDWLTILYGSTTHIVSYITIVLGTIDQVVSIAEQSTCKPVKVLSVGCGSGWIENAISQSLRSKSIEFEFILVDIDANALKAAQQKFESDKCVRFVVADVTDSEKLEKEIGSRVDIVYALGFFFYLPRQAQAKFFECLFKITKTTKSGIFINYIASFGAWNQSIRNIPIVADFFMKVTLKVTLKTSNAWMTGLGTFQEDFLPIILDAGFGNDWNESIVNRFGFGESHCSLDITRC